MRLDIRISVSFLRYDNSIVIFEKKVLIFRKYMPKYLGVKYQLKSFATYF